MEDSQTEALRTYSLILAGVGGFLPLLLTLMAYSVLGQVVLHSQGMTTAQKLHVAVLVASGVALCLLLCCPPDHTRAPCGCQVALDGSLPQVLQ